MGRFGTPPPSFRRVPEIEEGAFAFSSANGQNFQEVVGSFDMVPRFDVVDSDYLVFTVGQLDKAKPLPPGPMRRSRPPSP